MCRHTQSFKWFKGYFPACTEHFLSHDLFLSAYRFQLPASLPLKFHSTFSSHFKIVFPLLCGVMRCGQLAIELFLGLKHKPQTFFSDCIFIFSSPEGSQEPETQF